jgi:hypothetical protein
MIPALLILITPHPLPEWNPAILAEKNRPPHKAKVCEKGAKCTVTSSKVQIESKSDQKSKPKKEDK